MTAPGLGQPVVVEDVSTLLDRRRLHATRQALRQRFPGRVVIAARFASEQPPEAKQPDRCYIRAFAVCGCSVAHDASTFHFAVDMARQWTAVGAVVNVESVQADRHEKGRGLAVAPVSSKTND